MMRGQRNDGTRRKICFSKMRGQREKPCAKKGSVSFVLKLAKLASVFGMEGVLS